MKYFIKLSLISIFLLIFQKGFSQSNKLWTVTNARQNQVEILQRSSNPEYYKSYHLNRALLKQLLTKAPKRNSKFGRSKVVIPFPDDSGKMIDFAILKASVMAPELAKKYPDNMSYIGQSLLDKSINIRFSVNQLGVYAMIFKAGNKVEYIDPIDKNRTNYMVYKRSSLPERDQASVCLTKETKGFNVPNVQLKALNANDTKLRTFRLALAATAEYSQFQVSQAGVSTGTDAQKRAAVLAAMTTTMTRVNGVYEKDVALTMVLVDNNDQLIYLEDTTLNPDPYTNGNGATMLDENQTNIDAVIGTANYDIGHVFSTGGGGIAHLNAPCTVSKAQGVTGQSSPVGDAFDIDFVAHEMGHQFGATHTFNGTTGSCNGNRTNSTAVEPGSGSTIMAYAGICSPQNVQQHSDAYFHIVSIEQMFANITTGASTCGDISNLANNQNVPVVDAGADVSIPRSTPFKLTAVGSDADNDALTYTWEQTDTEITAVPPSATATGGSVFRSLNPVTDTYRYFPALSTVLSGKTASTWEVVPDVSRTLNFDVTVRDNVIGGGQTAKDSKVVTVVGTAGPFKVISQDINTTVDVGSTQSVNWTVAGTDLPPINCSQVDILLSTDGGFTFPITLATKVPNTGSYDVVIPNNLTTVARIMVKSVNNVFFSINPVKFSIQQNSFALLPEKNSTDACSGSNAVLNYTYNTFNGFNDTTVLSTTNLPRGVVAVFNPTTVSTDGTTVQLTLSGIADGNLGANDISVIATAPSLTRTVVTNLQVYSPTFTTQTITSPSDGSIGVTTSPTLSWDSQGNAKSYDVQVAVDINFNTIVKSANTTETSYTLMGLNEATTYYWRVRPVNPCINGAYSATNVFATLQTTCTTTTYADAPIAIPDNSTVGATSTINVPNNITISDVNIGVNITHQWIGDIELNITSPSNKTVQLIASSSCAPANMSVIFNDDGNSALCNGAAPGYSGVIKPSGNLSDYNGDNAQGVWTLFMEDQGQDDIGSLTSWNVEVCSVASVPLAVENFGISSLNMWPNPTKGDLNISMLNQKLAQVNIQVIDVLGRRIKAFHFKNTSTVFNTKLSLNNLSKGVYSVRVIKGNKVSIKKIILY
ncbi:MAG: M12 family metallo-peptidase [Flavobacteriaceae bacterium]